MPAVLSIQTERALRNDRTVAHNKQLFQVTSKVAVQKVIVEERLSGAIRIRGAHGYLHYRRIRNRPKKTSQGEPKKKFTKPRRPAEDHPWRHPLILAADAPETGHF